MEQPHSFGYWLKRRRKALDLTQAALGRQVGCSAATIRKIEAEERRPSVQVAQRLAAVCQIGLEQRPAFLRFARGDWQAAPAAPFGETLRLSFPPGPQPPPPHNLPVQITRFFGREAELALLAERLAENRLVTLTGPGGVGKTRLALRGAEDNLHHFGGGVWLVELAPLAAPWLAAQQAASALGLRDQPGQPALETLLGFLRERQTLLVLDNCEHLLPACAQLAEALLRACPRLKILVTSREPLHVDGEALLPVPSLPYPTTVGPTPPGQLAAAQGLQRYAAINLLVDRARLVLPGFAATPQNAADLARICQRLDGIPLAIEMAAARLRLLDTETVAAHLEDAFGLLTNGRRTALPKHQTLRAMIDWSYRLLSESEQRLLRRLAVFAGSGTLDAAQAICAGEGLSRIPRDRDPGISGEAGLVVDEIAALADKSILRVEHSGGALRWRLLETMRQYGREKLEAAGETARLSRLHRDYYYALVAAHEPTGTVDHWTALQQKLQPDLDNVRQALDWSLNQVDCLEAAQAAVRFVIAALGWLPSPFERLELCKRALPVCESWPGVSRWDYSNLLRSITDATAINDPPASLAYGKKAVEVGRGLGPAGALVLISNLHTLQTFYLQHFLLEPAQATFDEIEAAYRTLNSELFTPRHLLGTRAYHTHNHALLALLRGEPAEAKRIALECVGQCEAMGRHPQTAGPHITFGAACLQLAEYDQAQEHFRLALAVSSDPFGRSHTLRWLTLGELRQGHLERGLEYCRESLQQAAQGPDRNIMATDFGLAANLYAQQGRRLRAALLAGAAQAMYARQQRTPWEDSSLDTLLPGWRAAPDEAALTRAFDDGRAMEAERVIALVADDGDLDWAVAGALVRAV